MEEKDHADDQTPEILDESSTELENTASLNSSVSEIEASGDESSTELENTSSLNSSVSEIVTSGDESSTKLENTSSPNSSVSEIEMYLLLRPSNCWIRGHLQENLADRKRIFLKNVFE